MNPNKGQCLKCGLFEPAETLVDGFCQECFHQSGRDSSSRKLQAYEQSVNARVERENPYLLLGFFEFAIIGTLMVVFFPWSLLFCVIVYGIEETKLLVFALLHDFLKTALAIFSVVLSLGLLIVAIVALAQ